MTKAQKFSVLIAGILIGVPLVMLIHAYFIEIFAINRISGRCQESAYPKTR